jgi:hypothetical protein
MQAEGFQSLFNIKDLSVMGIMEVIPRLPVILRRKKEVLDDIEKIKPEYMKFVLQPSSSIGGGTLVCHPTFQDRTIEILCFMNFIENNDEKYLEKFLRFFYE